MREGRGQRRVVGVLVVAAVLGLSLWGEQRRSVRRHLEAVSRGERIYRQGVLADGSPTQAVVRGDIVVDGTMFTCVGCHLESGFGAQEGRFLAPPITGAALFAPVKATFKHVEVQGAPPRRPAYTRESLLATLTSGVDPSGRTLDEVMPRYRFGPEQVDDLVAYLETLSAQTEPGVTDDEVFFATVVTPGVPPEELAVLEAALDKGLAQKNLQTPPRETGHDNRSARMASQMVGGKDVAFKRLVRRTWRLEGAPETWRAQLEAHLAREPVWALLSGLGRGSWAPVHEFADAHRLPCLFPVTELPPARTEGGTTLYLSRGALQDGDAAMRFLAEQERAGEADAGADAGGTSAGTAVQVVRDDAEDRARAFAADQAARELGRPAAVTVAVAAGARVDVAAVGRGLGERGAVLLWDVDATAAEVDALAALPGVTLVLLPGEPWAERWPSLSPLARSRAALTWRRRLPDDEAARQAPRLLPVLGEAALDGGVPAGARRYQVAAAAFAATEVLNLGLMDLKGHWSRGHLLDVIGMQKDQELPGFERLGFGVGQRVAVKGAWIVRVRDGEAPRLEKASRWLTH